MSWSAERQNSWADSSERRNTPEPIRQQRIERAAGSSYDDSQPHDSFSVSKATWAGRRDELETNFQRVRDEYIQSAQREPNNITKLNYLESQMTGYREDLSRLLLVVKEAVEEIREKTGNAEQPILDLEKSLERLSAEARNLEKRKETREEQVAALSRRTEDNPHTIGFLMLRPLQNPILMIIITTLLVAGAVFLNYYYIRQFLTSLGFNFTIPAPLGRPIITM